MTTTTSSSNSRSRPSGRLFDHQFFELYRTVVKQNLIPMGMYLVALLLTAVLPDYTSASQVDMSIITPNSLHPRVSSFAFCVLGFVVPVMLATMLFHYLHTRLSVDFYHGMPISRDRLFFTRYFAGLTFLLPPLLICKVLSLSIQLAFYHSVLSPITLLSIHLQDFLFWAVLYSSIFTISCMVAVTSSNTIESILYSAALNGAGSVLLFMVTAFSGSLYGAANRNLLIPASLLSPYALMAYYMNHYSYTPLPDNNHWLIGMLLWLVLGFAALMLALHLYRRFHSEWAQQWGRQTIFTQIMKILAGMLMMFLVFGIQFFDDPVTNALLGCLVGAPLGFLLVEGVTGKGFSKLRSNGRSIALLMALCLVVPIFFATDGFGQVYRIPAEEKIQQLSFRMATGASRYSSYSWVDTNGIWHGNFVTPKSTLTSEHAKKLVLQLHRNGLDLKDYTGQTSSFYEITYSLEPNGHKLSRRYRISARDLPLLEQIYCEPEMIQSSEPVFFYQPELLEQVTLYNAIGSRIGTVDTEQYEDLLQAIREDLLTMTADRLLDYSSDSFCGYLEFGVKEYDESLRQNLELREQLQKLPYGSSKLILRSSYQKTLKLLESFGLNLGQPSTKVQSLVVTMPTMEDIDLDPTLSITSDLEDYAESIERSNLKWSITDPELIEQILAVSSPNRTSMSCNRLYLQTDSTEAPVRGVLFIENSHLLSILKDSEFQLPYLLSPSEYSNDLYPLLKQDIFKDALYEKSAEQSMQMLFDVSENISVAEFARQNGLNEWFENKSTEQLDAMERTALCSPDNTLVFYNTLIGY